MGKEQGSSVLLRLGAQEVVAVDEQGNREVIVRVEFPAFPMCIDFAADGGLLVVAGLAVSAAATRAGRPRG